jgi:hypothetical protein
MPISDEELRRRLEERHATFDRFVKPSTVALAVADLSDPTPAGILSNGTGFLIETSGGKFVVTNDHVYGAFESERAAFPGRRLTMTGAEGLSGIDLTEVQVVDRSSDYDLAVLQVPGHRVREAGKVFFPWHKIPPQRPRIGMQAHIYGYPGQGMVPLGDTLGLRHCLVLMKVEAVCDRDFRLVDTLGDVETVAPDGAPPLTFLGGMSGSPAVAFSETEFFLAGFLYKGSRDSKTLVVTYADRIKEDGTIGP